MGDTRAVPPVPDEATWQRAAEVGERTVREALNDKIFRRSQRGASAYDGIALLFGALTEAARELRAIANPDALQVLEEYALAYVRGACRGADGPLNADGSPFTRASS